MGRAGAGLRLGHKYGGAPSPPSGSGKGATVMRKRLNPPTPPFPAPWAVGANGRAVLRARAGGRCAAWAHFRRGRPGPMYQWLLGALGALLAAARRPAPPPAPPPRKRPPPSVQLPAEDRDKVPAKRRKLGYGTSEPKENIEEVFAAVKLPAEATSECQKASVSNAAPITESAEETQPASSDPSSERRAGSALETEMLEIDKMPCGTNACLNKETLSLSYKTIPHLSPSRNGKHHVKPTPGDILTLRPPIRECAVPESTTSEGSKMGRLFCTAEEGVQRGEKEKYKQLLQLVKEKYPRRHSTPQPTGNRNVQAYSKEPVTTESHLEEQKYGNIYPCVTLMTGIKQGVVCSPQWSQGSDMIRYYTAAENFHEQGRPVKQAVVVKQYGTEISKEALFQLHLSPVPSRTSSALGVEEKKLPSSEKTVEHVSALTEAMEREVMAAFGKGLPDEIMSSAFKLKVTREDIHTLKHLHWLNDEVINFYMTLLMERNKKEGYPAVHAFSTFFYPKLISGGYKAVRRWTRAVDLFKQDLILVPIHLRVHWALVVIDVRKKTIRYFDSMAQKGDTICERLFQYLQEESREKRNLELTFSEWTLYSMGSHEIPQQLNGSDCGVFMCQYADCISRDKPITFTQDNMPYFRKKMVWEIIHQQLI
ncbi:sentrin-specific protease 2 [Falco naumanni]|uniref:sentrin-specific protease 2 n=1 Tax=Falco naumanni TaxID=148594 RepID=UPI001ADE13DB|nr:sentrin-specific protease 2 [Falco naumanni]